MHNTINLNTMSTKAIEDMLTSTQNITASLTQALARRRASVATLELATALEPIQAHILVGIANGILDTKAAALEALKLRGLDANGNWVGRR